RGGLPGPGIARARHPGHPARERGETLPMTLREAVAALSAKLAGWLHEVIVNLPNVLVALLVIALFWFLGRLVRRVLERLLGRVSHNVAVTRLLASASFLLVLAAG